MAIAGRVAIVPKGDWSADATYKRLDAVTHNNTLYFAKKEVPAGTATSNTEYWSKSIVGGAGGVATADEAGVVKPADGLSIAEDGTLKVSIDGTTLTMDQVNNVIKLADTLKEKINGAFPAANVANNQITTVEGFALDARQANPNIDGTLAKQLSDLNGSLISGHNYTAIQLNEEQADSGLLSRFVVGDTNLLFETWKAGVRQSVTDMSTLQYFNLDNAFSVPITETDICYATKVGKTVELKLTMRFTNDIASAETIMILPDGIRPAFYQKCPIIATGSDNIIRIQSVTVLPNGTVASDSGFVAQKWMFIQVAYHTT